MQQSPRQRRSCRRASHWLMHVNLSNTAFLKYHLQKVEASTGLSFRTSYHQHIVREMPEYMNNVLMAIGDKRISCSYMLDILLDCIGDLSQKHTTFQLTKMFGNEEAFAKYCIEVVISHYVTCAINKMRFDEERVLPIKEFNKMFDECKK